MTATNEQEKPCDHEFNLRAVIEEYGLVQAIVMMCWQCHLGEEKSIQALDMAAQDVPDASDYEPEQQFGPKGKKLMIELE